MYAQYEGFIDVYVHDLAEWDEIVSAAIKEMRRTAYPDYNASQWRMTSFKQIGH
jgi:hypothetical protein